MLSWNALVPLILSEDFSPTSTLEIIDLELYRILLRTPGHRSSSRLPRKPVIVSTMSPIAQSILTKARDLVNQYTNVNHQGRANVLISCFLDPLSRFILSAMSPALHEEAKTLVIGVTEEFKPVAPLVEERQSTSGKKVLVVGATKVKKSVVQEVDDYIASPLENQELILSTCCLVKICRTSDPLKFWSMRFHMLPLLSRTARNILSCPGSTAVQERMFSVVNQLWTFQRSGLGGRLEALAALQMNRDLFAILRRHAPFLSVNILRNEDEPEMEVVDFPILLSMIL
jgi:hypothetical protein